MMESGPIGLLLSIKQSVLNLTSTPVINEWLVDYHSSSKGPTCFLSLKQGTKTYSPAGSSPLTDVGEFPLPMSHGGMFV